MAIVGAFGFLLLGAAAVLAATGAARQARRCVAAAIGVLVIALALTGVAEYRYQRCLTKYAGDTQSCVRSPWQGEGHFSGTSPFSGGR